MTNIKQWLKDSVDSKRSLVASNKREIKKASDLICDAIIRKKNIFFCGNGGSMSDAQHAAAELVGRFKNNRKPIKADCLGASAGNMSCIANDFGYENVFSRELEAKGQEEDLLIAITTSGFSKNVIKAISKAVHMNIDVVVLTGMTGKTNLPLMFPEKVTAIAPKTDITARIQESHIFLIHCLVEMAEQRLWPILKTKSP